MSSDLGLLNEHKHRVAGGERDQGVGGALAVGTAVDVLVWLERTRFFNRDRVLAMRTVELPVSDYAAAIPFKPPGGETQDVEDVLGCLLDRICTNDVLLNPPLRNAHDDRENHGLQS